MIDFLFTLLLRARVVFNHQKWNLTIPSQHIGDTLHITRPVDIYPGRLFGYPVNTGDFDAQNLLGF